MDIGFIVLAVVVDKLATVEDAEYMFLLEAVFDSDNDTRFVEFARRVEFNICKRIEFAFGDIPFNLQAAAQHILTLAAHLIIFPYSLVEVKVVDYLGGAVGVLPSFS